MRSCRDTTKLLSESMDRDLPLRTRVGLRLHLMMCKYCKRYAQQLQFIHKAFGENAERLAESQSCQAPPLPEDRRRRIESALNDQLGT